MDKNKEFTYGKIPPQSIDLESYVLGCIMMNRESIYQIMDIISPDSFYKENNKTIYECLYELARNDKPTDLVFTANRLKELQKLDEIGGPFYLSELTRNVSHVSDVEIYAKVIQQNYVKRELIRISSEIYEKSFDESLDVQELLDFSEKSIFDLNQGIDRSNESIINDIILKALNKTEKLSKQKNKLTGIPSGFPAMDNEITDGWQNSDLIILGARPAMGKTFIGVIKFALESAFNEYPVGVFSLEMSKLQLGYRYLSLITESDSRDLRNGKNVNWQKIENNISKFDKLPIYIDDSPGINIYEIGAKIRRMIRKYGIKLIIIDYLQLISTREKFDNKATQISFITAYLKNIAKKLDIPIILLSQLNRELEKRHDKRPMMSDLKESGAIEQDADLIMFLYRPEAYGIIDGDNPAGRGEIIVSKNRNGSVGSIYFFYKNDWSIVQDKSINDVREFQTKLDNLNPF